MLDRRPITHEPIIPRLGPRCESWPAHCYYALSPMAIPSTHGMILRMLRALQLGSLLGVLACAGALGCGGGASGTPDAGVDLDAAIGGGSLEIELRLALDEVELAPGVVVFPEGSRLERFILGIHQIAWDGDVSSTPMLELDAPLDLLDRPRLEPIPDVPPGIYSRLELRLDSLELAPALDAAGLVDGEAKVFTFEGAIALELRCEEGLPLDPRQRLVVPVQVDARALLELLDAPPEGADAADALRGILEDAIHLECASAEAP